MRVAFFPSFRPLEHARASGLVAIARDVDQALRDEGHEVVVPLHRSMEWIHRRPQLWWPTLRDIWRADRVLRQFRPDCWLTYHSYYRGPDIAGPLLTRKHRLPYCILAASYATKYRKRWKTWGGFQLNRLALLRADMVFVNKRRDLDNLGRLLPPERLSYVRPGIRIAAFPFDPDVRAQQRARLEVTGKRVVVTAAMLRPGVKEEGVAVVIEACARLRQRIPDVHLLILGDGPGRLRLAEQAQCQLPGAHTFAGRVPSGEMYRYYLAGDVFAFPGINESLGMVYLEAQCCGLPVVATGHDGAPEVVADRTSGIIVPPFAVADFAEALSVLLTDDELRVRYGRQARERVLQLHDMSVHYRQMFAVMARLCAARKR